MAIYSTGHRKSSTYTSLKCVQYGGLTLKIHACKNLLNYYMHLELYAFDLGESPSPLHAVSVYRYFSLTTYLKSDKSFAQLKRKEGKNLRGSECIFPSLTDAALIEFLG